MEHKKFTPKEVADIKTWGETHISAILNYFGIKVNDRGKYLTGCCPIPYHPGDASNPKAFVWSFDKGNWHCYSHGCQSDTSSDIIGLVQSMKEMAFPIAIKFLYELKNGELQNAPEVIPTQSKDSTINTHIDIAKLKILMADKYFKGRGIREDVLQKHHVGYWQKVGTFMDRRAIVPVFDIESNLVGFTGRTLLNKDELNSTGMAKWVHGRDFVTRKAGTFNKQSVLYNLNHAKDVIQRTGKVYMVEGPIDVWKMQMAGIFNVVATLGLGLSIEQINLLVALSVQDVVICYDNDEHDAGLNAAHRIRDSIGEHFDVVIKIPENGKDYGEMTVAEVLGALL